MRKETILLADNDPEFLKTSAELLEEYGYRVIRASTPKEAEDGMMSGRADLAILDIRLREDADAKDISGLELAREVARSLPKVILTDHPTRRNISSALKIQTDGLPSAVEFVGKKDGFEALLEGIRLALGPDLRWMRSIQNALGTMDDELTEDYKNAQKQAKVNYVWALVFAIAGAVVTFSGIGLAYWQKLEIGLVSTVAGLISELVSYLFYRRVDKANVRMDNYHRERMEGQRYEILLKTCEGLETPAERETCRKNIIQAALSWWLEGGNKPANSKPDQGT